MTSISADAFAYTGLTSVTFQSLLKSVGQYAFQNCRSLTQVDLGNVETLGRGVFNYCTSLTSVTVPATVKSMDHHVFTQCTSLTYIDILADNAYIYYSLVDDTPYYNDPNNWKNGVLYIGKYAVVGNTDKAGVTSLTLEANTTVIAAFAFEYNCRSLTSVTLPSSLLTVGESAFKDCAKLNSINMPDSVTRVGSDVLKGTAIYDSNGSYWSDNGFYVGKYLLAVKNTSLSKFTVKDGTKLIADGELFGNYASSLTEVTLPASLEVIGTENFSNTGITEIVLPASLKKISEKAFYYCSSLTSVDTSVCTALDSIGYSAFAGCNISSFDMPASVRNIDELIFNFNADITVNCPMSSAPDGWHPDWSKNNRGSVTVNWGSAV